MTKSEVEQQLHMLHNPFAATTSQPKIPDGKTNESLGFSTQAVGEIGNRLDTSTLHILLYAGMNSALVAQPCAQANLQTRTYYIPPFVGSGGVDWSYAQGSPNATAGFTIETPDNYALWRTVSCGLQLKLLNATEEDDGWWESFRVTPEFRNYDYILTTSGNVLDNAGDHATLAPVNLLTGLEDVNIANEQSYSTGLLRDINRVQFETHGKLDDHDFRVMKNEIYIPTEANAGHDETNMKCMFVNGSPEPVEVINQFIDPSYDMVYIRLHCRLNNETTSLGSRFHYNLISNQEINFDHRERESRFHTKSHSMGAGATSLHLAARRGNQNSAKMAIG